MDRDHVASGRRSCQSERLCAAVSRLLGGSTRGRSAYQSASEQMWARESPEPMFVRAVKAPAREQSATSRSTAAPSLII